MLALTNGKYDVLENTKTTVSRLVSLSPLISGGCIGVVTLWLQHAIMVRWGVPDGVGTPVGVVTKATEDINDNLPPVNRNCSPYIDNRSVELPFHIERMIRLVHKNKNKLRK